MKAVEVSKLFLFWSAKNGDNPITNLKLQKLLYYAQGWSFVELKKELFEDEIEAWQYGPVVPGVYNTYKSFKNLPIEYDIEKDNSNIEENFDKETLDFLKKFYESYIVIPAFRLVESSHQERPWLEAYNNKGPKSIIEKGVIKEFFEEWNNKE